MSDPCFGVSGSRRDCTAVRTNQVLCKSENEPLVLGLRQIKRKTEWKLGDFQEFSKPLTPALSVLSPDGVAGKGPFGATRQLEA